MKGDRTLRSMPFMFVSLLELNRHYAGEVFASFDDERGVLSSDRDRELVADDEPDGVVKISRVDADRRAVLPAGGLDHRSECAGVRVLAVNLEPLRYAPETDRRGATAHGGADLVECREESAPRSSKLV